MDARTPEPPDAAEVDAAGSPDVGPIDSGVPECTTNAECPSGSACSDQACTPCPSGICACHRDDDCPATDICDHAQGVCGPPIVPCAEVTDEAVCLGRADCQAIYAGVNCRDAMGGACTSSDPECTCETFSFAMCALRAQ